MEAIIVNGLAMFVGVSTIVMMFNALLGEAFVRIRENEERE